MLSYQLLALATIAAAKTPISPDLYTRMQRYTNFSSAAYDVPCPDPPYNSKVVNTINIPNTDTQASIFRDDAAQEVILAFPGTSDFTDWLTDLNFTKTAYVAPGITNSSCGGCEVHQGFLGAWTSIAQEVIAKLDDALADNSGYSVTVTGHSLGGAISSLATASLKSFGNYTMNPTFTFGQPRVGDSGYAAFMDKLNGATGGSAGDYYRVTHLNDEVPRVPPEDFGFMHHKSEYWQKNGMAGRPSANTTYLCFGNEPEDCNDSTIVGTDIVDVHTHYSDIHLDSGAACGEKKSSR